MATAIAMARVRSTGSMPWLDRITAPTIAANIDTTQGMPNSQNPACPQPCGRPRQTKNSVARSTGKDQFSTEIMSAPIHMVHTQLVTQAMASPVGWAMRARRSSHTPPDNIRIVSNTGKRDSQGSSPLDS